MLRQLYTKCPSITLFYWSAIAWKKKFLCPVYFSLIISNCITIMCIGIPFNVNYFASVRAGSSYPDLISLIIDTVHYIHISNTISSMLTIWGICNDYYTVGVHVCLSSDTYLIYHMVQRSKVSFGFFLFFSRLVKSTGQQYFVYGYFLPHVITH